MAASVLLWDFLPVQTNRAGASGLMGTRPAQGPKPPPLLHFPLLYARPKLHRRSLQLKDALQLSQTDLKIFPVPLHSFPTLEQFMTFHGSTSALTFLTPEQPDSTDPCLSPLSLTLTCLLYHSSFSSPLSRIPHQALMSMVSLEHGGFST